MKNIERYTLISGRLYFLGQDNVLRLCLDPENIHSVIVEAHVTIGGSHAFRTQMENCILCNEYWWPTLTKDVVDYM